MSNLPRVDGVKNSIKNIDLDTVTLTLSTFDLDSCDVDPGKYVENRNVAF